jgi:hypothetical protein
MRAFPEIGRPATASADSAKDVTRFDQFECLTPGHPQKLMHTA